MNNAMDSGFEECDVLILGAGLGGLAAARALGSRALVLERESRPGGLVRSEEHNDYIFDHTLHILYFPDKATEARVMAIDGHHLAACPPEAWVETHAGIARFPIQLHLGSLEATTAAECIRGIEAEEQAPVHAAPTNFEDMLLRTFGKPFCELFFHPYNRKMWKRPLDTLAPSGFQWNIARPEMAAIKRGFENPDAEYRAYNADGWYPQPPAGAPLRGIELLAHALARGVDVRLGHTVTAIDTDRRTVTVTHVGRTKTYVYRTACISTLPLPQVATLCSGLPAAMKEACRTLAWNRVVTVALFVKGPRPAGTGHWRYYTDESIVFNRLIWPHLFDPLSAPEDGWVLLAEITERSEDPPTPEPEIVKRVLADAARVGALPDGNTVVETRLLTLNPGYVVFRPGEESLIKDVLACLREQDILPLGRYGRWEYSSMAQVMRDGFAQGDALVNAGTPDATREPAG
jgi:protoporphyrinogen oxidase